MTYLHSQSSHFICPSLFWLTQEYAEAIVHQNVLIAFKERSAYNDSENVYEDSRRAAKMKVIDSLWLEVKNSSTFGNV